MRHSRLLSALIFACLVIAELAQAAPQTNTAQAVVSAPESIIADNVPPIPDSVAEAAGRYTDYRTAMDVDWHPQRREMLVTTRFGNTLQLHLVKTPGGARQQLTFSPEPVREGSFHPNGGDYIVFRKDTGGGEWYQLYRYDMASGDTTLLTDGKSRNLLGPWSSRGDQIAYTSTRRTGQDSDVWAMNPADPKTDRLLTQVNGGGWDPEDWSPDDKKLLLLQGISVNETYLWMLDTASGEKSPLFAPTDEKVAYTEARFSKDGKGIYFTSDKGSEFLRLMYMDFATKQTKILTQSIPWDVLEFALSYDGKKIALITDEDGQTILRVLDASTGKELQPKPKLPAGVISFLRWHRNNRDLAFSMSSSRLPGDCFSLDVQTGKLERWTFSETAVKTESFPDAKLIRWKSFDGRMISGFLYRPSAKFAGKRPVLVMIHGGPEDQELPTFLGRNNYFLNELGIALILPNVRGSTGYGKSFTKLDNGFLREDSYKDINALFDWIATQPDLDRDRVAVTGGSYGGHMTLAVSTFYSNRIRCSVDVVGMSNLVTFLEHTEAYRRDLRRAEYGDERDPKMRAFLEKIAPMNNIEKIQKPMMVVAGQNDPRVPISESNQIVTALKRQQTPVWYIFAKDEGHGYQKKQNQDFQFYTMVEFLQEYLLQ